MKVIVLLKYNYITTGVMRQCTWSKIFSICHCGYLSTNGWSLASPIIISVMYSEVSLSVGTFMHNRFTKTFTDNQFPLQQTGM